MFVEDGRGFSPSFVSDELAALGQQVLQQLHSGEVTLAIHHVIPLYVLVIFH